MAERSLTLYSEAQLPEFRSLAAAFETIAALDLHSTRQLLEGALPAEPNIAAAYELGQGAARGLKPQAQAAALAAQIWTTCGQKRRLIPSPMALTAGKSGYGAASKRRVTGHLRALADLFCYGCLHGQIWQGNRRRPEAVAVPWSLGRDANLHALKRRAISQGRSLEVVLDKPSPWEPGPVSPHVVVNAVSDGACSYLWDGAGNTIAERRVMWARLGGKAFLVGPRQT